MATAPAEWKRNTRYSLRQLENWAEQGYRKPLEDLLRAWRAIQDLPIDDPDSFWVIAGYHGIPLAPFDGDQPHLPPPFSWWGGYCHHGNVLFPTWHRAYTQRLENALRNQVPDASMAYWDKGSKESRHHGIPRSLTDETIELDGEVFPNPLMCYTFPVDIESSAQFQKPAKPSVADFSKRAGTQTVRYPMSAFYASKMDKVAAAGIAHNEAMKQMYPLREDRLQALNLNIKLALVGDTAQDQPNENCDGTADGETYARLRLCLDTPNYNVFSNNNSTGKWYTSLEQPHDEMHLAIGGQDHQPIKTLASPKLYEKNPPRVKADPVSPIMGSNGDMGENETAAFDPIFFFHHANIDRMFWIWQKKWGKTAENSIEIDPTDMEGTYGQSPKGQGGTRATPGITKLTMDTPLHPFKSSSGECLTSRDVVDLKTQLGVEYSLGSFDKEEWPDEAVEKPGPEIIFSVVNINKASFLGSFRVTVSHQDISKHTYTVEFVDRRATEDRPIAASGQYSGGEWKPLMGREKIESVRIEVDERQ